MSKWVSKGVMCFDLHLVRMGRLERGGLFPYQVLKAYSVALCLQYFRPFRFDEICQAVDVMDNRIVADDFHAILLESVEGAGQAFGFQAKFAGKKRLVIGKLNRAGTGSTWSN